MSNLPAIWTGSEEIIIPTSAIRVDDIIPYANGLTEKQQRHIIQAFGELQAYDMAVEFTWRRTISRLKESLASLGMQFIGEMLGRDDISDSTPYETVLTEFQAIQLSEQLGLISSTASLYLRQSLEIITHFSSDKSGEELDALSALNIIKNSIKYVLGHQDMMIAMEFTNFRKRLLTDNLKASDPQIEMLANAPVFYARTVSFILLNSIRKDKGAKVEHALANFNIILPLIWEKFNDNDRWNVGFAYRDVVSENNVFAVNGLKQALMKVKGFDFVPESLRSNTFIKAARNIIDVHYSYNNYYNEPAAVKALALLGTTIPKPAFAYCIQAYLVICIGNRYGISTEAASLAEDQLSNINSERWIYYINNLLLTDEEVLYNLSTANQIMRFSRLLNNLELSDLSGITGDVYRFYKAIVERNVPLVARLRSEFYSSLK